MKCGKKVRVSAAYPSGAFAFCRLSKGHLCRCSADLIGLRFGKKGEIKIIGAGKLHVNARGVSNVRWKAEHESGKQSLPWHEDLICNDIKGSFHGLARSPEYHTVQRHHNCICVNKLRPEYKGTPFHDDWNPDKGGAFWRGAKWLLENLPRPKKDSWDLHIIDRRIGFVPGNLVWVPRGKHKREELVNKLLLENKTLKEKIEWIVKKERKRA